MSLYEQIKADLGDLNLDAAAGSFATVAEQGSQRRLDPHRVLGTARRRTGHRRSGPAPRGPAALRPFSYRRTVDRKLVEDPATLRFIDENRPIIFSGQPG